MWRSWVRAQSEALVVSLSKKLYPYCSVLVGSRNGFKREFKINTCYKHLRILPECLSSKQAKAFRMTSSGSVPLSLSPNRVRNIVKLIGPGASDIIFSRNSSDGSFPVDMWSYIYKGLLIILDQTKLHCLSIITMKI